MKKRFVRLGAVLAASALLFCAGNGAAEERRLGDYIYVPAMSAPEQTGRITLRAEGVALSEDGGEVGQAQALAGVELGVYVINGEGELVPWANPLYPSEPMRVRTGEEPVGFTLPEGPEFYLVPLSVPDGYVVMDGDEPTQEPIPVLGEEIVVRCIMPGELVIAAQDSLGTPLPGVEIAVDSLDGESCSYVTDQSGQVKVGYVSAAQVSVREAGLPEGVFAARGVSVNGQAQEGVSAQAQVRPSQRTQVIFEHPASGMVQLSMLAKTLDANGEAMTTPLSGVVMAFEGAQQGRMVTDEQGQASASLVEGVYTVRLSYEGSEAIVLPLTEGKMIVESGLTTLIELSAPRAEGRISVQAQSGRPVSGGVFVFENEKTGDQYGPYELDGEGLLVSELLPAGDYFISRFEEPDGVETELFACGGESKTEPDALGLVVEPGELTLVTAQMRTMERANFALLRRDIGETGKTQENALSGVDAFELLDEMGESVALVEAQNGSVTVEALAGRYALRMPEETARSLGVQAVSETFRLPGQDEAIAFLSAQARLVLSAVDENGRPVTGAVYTVTDSEGTQVSVACDESGMAVTPLLAQGEVSVKTESAPDGYDAAEALVQARAGEAGRVQMVHERFGEMRLSVQMKSLDDRGGEALSPLSGARVRLYRVQEDGQRMTDTGLALTAGEDGRIEQRLEAGEYVAQLDADSLEAGCRAGEALRFSIANTQSVEGELFALNALGGVRVQMIGSDLTDEILAQIRFELVDASGETTELSAQESAFYAGGLAAGTYLLRQTQIPQGYTLSTERTVTVTGAEVAGVSVPLEEYAVLSVSKTGLTFNDKLQSYIVPLTGEYGVYTLQDGQMKAYPSEERQMTVWAGVTAEQAAQGKAAQVKLPAVLEGTVYYLHELSEAQGFCVDEAYHEVCLSAGEERVLDCAVTSDRGFFELSQLDAADGANVAGGVYELRSEGSGEQVLTFEMGEEPYRNEMAVPVGDYVLRQLSAGEGYALSAEPEVFLTVEPYLSEGGQVTQVAMTSVRMPENEQMDVLTDLYAAREQGLTLISVDSGALGMGETLLVPQMTLSVAAEGGERVNVASMVLSSASDAQGTVYAARVEYCLAGGGWQPSDARLTGALTAPTAVSLADVEDDICAVRVTYLNAETGEERAGEGFAPGQVTINARVGAQGGAMLRVNAEMAGLFVYREAWGEAERAMRRASALELSFEAEGDGAFETVSAGRDGRISGAAFFDENADGVLSAFETGRYAGMTVSLVSESGTVVDSCRTDAAGRYAFTSISGGSYTVQFEAGSSVVYSSGERYSEHAISGVKDTRYGVSAPIVIDGDHTDYVVNAGCIYASKLSGAVMELEADGELSAYSGLSVEMRASGAGDADEEPTVIVTDGSGHYGFTGVLPGDYEVTLRVPQGFLCEEAENGAIVRYVSFEQGEEASFGEMVITREAKVSGHVMIDDDGDGVIAQGAGALGGVKVTLLRVEDGHTEQVAQTAADESGYYAFDGLYAGRYSVLFELSGDWTFTRYGEGSCVYGAVSQSGSSREFGLVPGESVEGMDAGVTLPAQLSVTVFKDTQFDGQKGVYEQGLEGASISLIRLENGEDAEEISYRTDAEGSVLFTGVSPGEYVLDYQLPGLWRATVQVDPKTTSYPVSCVPQSTSSAGRSEPFVLSMGQSGVRLYIGAMLSGSISGTVYDDANDNAQQDDGEEPCSGVRVELLDAQENVLDERVTGESGSYSFEGLAPARYRVRFTASEGCGFSGTERTAAKGGVQESDSEVSTTKPIAVTAGEATVSADAGVVRLCEVRGFLWEDRNADGAWGDDERALSGVSVQLMNGAGRTVLETAQTGENGEFSFGRLRPDTYKLRVDAPDGYVFSGALAESPLGFENERDGRGYSAAFTLLGGVRAEGIGFGLLTQGSIGGRVFVDANYDGLMGEEEDGLRGVSIALQNSRGEQVAQTTTVRSGEFGFSGLMPGEYTLLVTLEEGYVFTAGGGDSLAARSDEPVTRIELGELEMGTERTDVRIGVLKPASIGGTAFMDSDNDGRRQSGDAGLSGVRVALDVLEGTDAGLHMETVTNESGVYRFDGVMPGQAKLTFEIPDGHAFAKNAKGTRYVSVVPQADALVASAETLSVVTAKDQLGLDVGVVSVGTVSGVVWEDSAYDGLRGADERGVAGARIALVDARSGAELKTAITGEDGAYAIDFVRVGEYTLRVSLPEGMMFTREGESRVAMADTAQGETQSFTLVMGESANDYDFGAIAPASVSGEIYIDGNENGARDAGDGGLSGAAVTLMQGGTAIATASTDANGGFSFGLLRPGAYRVRVTLPDNALFARGTQLHAAHADAQEGETGEFELAMGQRLSVEPVGAVKAARIAGCAWSDENADGMMDATEPSLGGVTVELLTEGGVVASAKTGEDGRYAFELLRSGEYAVRFTLPQGMLLADRVTGGASSVDVVPGCVGTTQSFALSQGEAREDMHIGGILPGRIGDTVWLDENANGLQDYKEPLLSGVSITLMRVLESGERQEVGTTESDEYGYYSFSNLRPGDYVLRVNTQEGDALTRRVGEPLGEIDSDAEPATGETALLHLESGKAMRSIDFGFTQRAQ